VTKGWPALQAQHGTTTERGKLARNARCCHRYHFDRQRKGTKHRLTSLDASAMQTKRSGQRGRLFFAGECRTTAFDHVAAAHRSRRRRRCRPADAAACIGVEHRDAQPRACVRCWPANWTPRPDLVFDGGQGVDEGG
jgi:hypothetical protein